MANYKYKAFISYSHQDERWAAWLHRSLESYRPPKGLGVSAALKPLFRDREELAASRDLSTSILQSIESSESMIVICSPAAVESRWVNAEIDEFIRLGKSHRIFCLIVDGIPGDQVQECLPGALRLDGISEPLAADARPNADGRTGAKLKIAAALLDVGLDELRQRDVQRQLRRLSALAVGASLGMLVMVALAWTTLIARDEAREAATLAKAQSQRAETVKRFLNEMLRTADPVTGSGPATTLEQILDAASNRLAGDILAAEPAVEAEIRESIGLAYLHLGDGIRASAELEAALALIDPVAPTEQRANLLRGLGQVRRSAGRFSDAEDLYLEVLSVVEDPGFDAPGRPAQLLVNGVRNDLGLLLQKQGRYDEAASVLEEVVSADRNLLEAGDVRLATSLNNLALVRRRQGERQEALSLFREALSLLVASYGEQHVHVAAVLESLGSLEQLGGNYDAALMLYEQSLEVRREVLGERNVIVAHSLNGLGLLHVQRNRPDLARVPLTQSLELHQSILGEAHPRTASVLNNIGLMHIAEGDGQSAVATLEECLALRSKGLGEAHASTLNTKMNLADALLLAGEPARSESLARGTIAQIESEGVFDVAYLARYRLIWGRALAALSRFDQAEVELSASYEQQLAEFGADHPRLQEIVRALIDLYKEWQRPADAERWRQELARQPPELVKV